MLAAIYGLQMLVFLFRAKWDMIGWMIFYLLAIPIFSFYLPLYSFWKMDDFSWGNTRVVVGEKGKKLVIHVRLFLVSRLRTIADECSLPMLLGRGQVRPPNYPPQVVERLRERALGQGVESLRRLVGSSFAQV